MYKYRKVLQENLPMINGQIFLSCLSNGIELNIFMLQKTVVRAKMVKKLMKNVISIETVLWKNQEHHG